MAISVVGYDQSFIGGLVNIFCVERPFVMKTLLHIVAQCHQLNIYMYKY